MQHVYSRECSENTEWCRTRIETDSDDQLITVFNSITVYRALDGREFYYIYYFVSNLASRSKLRIRKNIARTILRYNTRIILLVLFFLEDVLYPFIGVC